MATARDKLYDFIVAHAPVTYNKLLEAGMSLPAVKAALKGLIEKGKVINVHRGNKGAGGLYDVANRVEEAKRLAIETVTKVVMRWDDRVAVVKREDIQGGHMKRGCKDGVLRAKGNPIKPGSRLVVIGFPSTLPHFLSCPQ